MSSLGRWLQRTPLGEVRPISKVYIHEQVDPVGSGDLVPQMSSGIQCRSCLKSFHNNRQGSWNYSYTWSWRWGIFLWVTTKLFRPGKGIILIVSVYQRKIYLECPLKWKCESFSRVRLFATPWTVARQAPPSMEFPRQEYWSELPFPSPGGLPDPGI